MSKRPLDGRGWIYCSYYPLAGSALDKGWRSVRSHYLPPSVTYHQQMVCPPQFFWGEIYFVQIPALFELLLSRCTRSLFSLPIHSNTKKCHIYQLFLHHICKKITVIKIKKKYIYKVVMPEFSSKIVDLLKFHTMIKAFIFKNM